jgi:RNA polymerase sigma-70 factor (ECF subfamily)
LQVADMGLREAMMPLVPGLRRYARALVADPSGDAGRADDLVAETLQSALRSARLRAASDVRLPLYAMLIALNRSRLSGRGPAGSKSPGLAADQDRHGRSRIETALALLPVELREVLLLVVLERMTYEEAAEVLAVPLATMLARLTRARDDLRIHFNGTVVQSESHRSPAQAARHLRLVK